MQRAGQGEMLSRTEPARWGSGVREGEGVTGVVRLTVCTRVYVSAPRYGKPRFLSEGGFVHLQVSAFCFWYFSLSFLIDFALR